MLFKWKRYGIFTYHGGDDRPQLIDGGKYHKGMSYGRALQVRNILQRMPGTASMLLVILEMPGE